MMRVFFFASVTRQFRAARMASAKLFPLSRKMKEEDEVLCGVLRRHRQMRMTQSPSLMVMDRDTGKVCGLPSEAGATRKGATDVDLAQPAADDLHSTASGCGETADCNVCVWILKQYRILQ